MSDMRAEKGPFGGERRLTRGQQGMGEVSEGKSQERQRLVLCGWKCKRNALLCLQN